jgi:hypothetical protein
VYRFVHNDDTGTVQRPRWKIFWRAYAASLLRLKPSTLSNFKKHIGNENIQSPVGDNFSIFKRPRTCLSDCMIAEPIEKLPIAYTLIIDEGDFMSPAFLDQIAQGLRPDSLFQSRSEK